MDLSTRLWVITAICELEIASSTMELEVLELIHILATEEDEVVISRKRQLKRYGIDLVELEVP